jgi:hypothetical protein
MSLIGILSTFFNVENKNINSHQIKNANIIFKHIHCPKLYKKKPLFYLQPKNKLNGHAIFEYFFIQLRLLYSNLDKNQLNTTYLQHNNTDIAHYNKNIFYFRGAKDDNDLKIMCGSRGEMINASKNIFAHTGLLQKFDEIYPIIKPKIIQISKNNNKKLFLVGHSMGGGFAQLVTYKFSILFDEIYVFLYHTPPFFNYKFYNHLQNLKCKIRIFRIYNRKDGTNYIFPQFQYLQEDEPDFFYHLDFQNNLQNSPSFINNLFQYHNILNTNGETMSL